MIPAAEFTLSSTLTEEIRLRRADNNERFVAFALAAADMVAEVDAAGIITYAAGAYRSKLGMEPEAWVGQSLRQVVAPIDLEVLDTALMTLCERGRLLPSTVRLANPERTPMALAGLRLAAQGRPMRLCVTFALPPAPVAPGRPVDVACFARAMEAMLRADFPCGIELLEIEGATGETVGPALETLVPDALASEIGPGRFGIIGTGTRGGDLVSVAASLEAVLRGRGVAASVSSRNLPLAAEELSSTQAIRALRKALDVFARDGTAGLDAGGFGGGLAGYVQHAMQHAGKMRRLIAERRFSLVYQPIMTLSDRKLHHYEALLRPHQGAGAPATSPQDFVLLVETIGLAAELDLVVAEMASEAAEHSSVPIAFNVSGQSMQDPAFSDRLLTRLRGTPAQRAGRLVVEMTETAQLEDVAQAGRTALLLRELGVPFCLDDFGAGTADVRVLRAIPADIVKLDGSYIHGITSPGRERAFVAGMVDIARAAGARIVAEQVVTEAEAAVLLELGVDYGQGWLFGRPAKLPPGPARPVAVARRKGEVRDAWG